MNTHCRGPTAIQRKQTILLVRIYNGISNANLGNRVAIKQRHRQPPLLRETRAEAAVQVQPTINRVKNDHSV